ncbi:hypothetical protein C1S82_31215 [Mycolicibacterium cosmeticum]|uniref:hypothetical protein n=1 Tax=Mycolicibacterium TaxID=1866885 RepID=UPI00056763DC|nr:MULTISPECIES: hypothetical protein [Mycolicibacterium]MCX2715836.1 hypothetical protein [Mycolicibacterium sp. J2]TLH65099.1 hypothetical protein C1S82_31215 [Mycolicibacterium cosmeticum]
MDHGEQQRSRCAASVSAMLMVRHQASWFAQVGRGDGRPPAALWKAVLAEDWPTVCREWDKWVQPVLREMDKAEREWRATIAVMADSAARAVGQPFPADIHDPMAVQRQFGTWIRKQVTAAREGVRSDEWAQFSQALPAELQPMAAEHPTYQAEVAATTFEIEALHRNLEADADEGN